MRRCSDKAEWSVIYEAHSVYSAYIVDQCSHRYSTDIECRSLQYSTASVRAPCNHDHMKMRCSKQCVCVLTFKPDILPQVVLLCNVSVKHNTNLLKAVSVKTEVDKTKCSVV
jgi:hypothetical protein